MHGLRAIMTVWGVLALAACVTINVYFPAAAAEKAADRFIEEVWGENPGKRPPAAPGAAEPRSALPAVPALARLIDLLIPSAQAAEPNIDISSPAINGLQASMQARHGQLLPYYQSGAVGLTADGLIAVRDANAVPLAQRRQVAQLVAEENRDRTALYAEIARANGHPEWESQIRATFARRWVARAPSGWFYDDGAGWKRK